jgi:hypothetical protein
MAHISLIKVELKLEVYLLGIECLFHEIFEFVVEDYTMLQQL